eukprot:gene10346-12234_t
MGVPVETVVGPVVNVAGLKVTNMGADVGLNVGAIVSGPSVGLITAGEWVILAVGVIVGDIILWQSGLRLRGNKDILMLEIELIKIDRKLRK